MTGIFEGPESNGPAPGAVGSIYYETVYEGDGSTPFTGFGQSEDYFVGKNNLVQVDVYFATVGTPTDPTDVKWAEIALGYGRAGGTLRPTHDTATNDSELRNIIFGETDVISERHPTAIENQYVYPRYRIHRIAGSSDVEAQHPFVNLAGVHPIRGKSILSVALADYLRIYYRFVCLDENETPTLGAQDYLALSVSFGASATMP